MLRFIRISEFAEFTESMIYLGKTPLLNDISTTGKCFKNCDPKIHDQGPKMFGLWIHQSLILILQQDASTIIDSTVHYEIDLIR